MTTNHHTPIANGAPVNSATVNAPIGELDAQITSMAADIATHIQVWAGKTTAPTANDDSGDGIAIGDHWVDETHDREYVCVDNTVAAAIWLEIASPSLTTINGMKLTWNSATSVTVGIGSCYAENGDFINVTSALVKSSLSLSPSSWYHVYVYLSGGSPAAEVVTTAPAAWKGTAYRKTGDTSRRYVGSILTDGSGNVFPFHHAPFSNKVYYYSINTAGSPFRVLSTGTAAAAASVPCGGAAPVTASTVMITLSNTGDQIADVDLTNSVSATVQQIVMNTGVRRPAEQTIDSSQNFYYKFRASVGSGGLFIDVVGYMLER